MAVSGRKPTPVALKIITGNPGKRPLPEQRDPATHGEIPGGPVERPGRMVKAVSTLWDKYIARCHWLTWADGPKALMWCHMQAEYQKKPTAMIASRIAQLRALGSELGLDVASRDRMGVTIPTGRAPQQQDPQDGAKKEPLNPSKKYFD